jgi:hypothetical protein
VICAEITLDELSRVEDLDTSPTGDPPQVLVSRNDDGRARRSRTCQKHLIVGIFAGGLSENRRFHHLAVDDQQGEKLFEIHSLVALSQSESHPSILVQDGR